MLCLSSLWFLGLPGCVPTERPAGPAAHATTSPTQTVASPSPVRPQVTPSAAAIPVAAAQQPALFNHGDRSRPYIALTFDACEGAGQPAGYDQAVIEVLTRTKTPATLFLSGLWMQRHPDQTRLLAANPLFELGNHSWSHRHFDQLKPEEIRAEIIQTQELALKLTGQQPAVFRFPFNIPTEKALPVVAEHGLQTIGADVISGDPDPHLPASAVAQAVIRQAENGSIIIMHMNTRGWHTAEILPGVIQELRERGYTLVTVSRLPKMTGGEEDQERR